MTSKTDDIINEIIKILHEKKAIRPSEINKYKSNSDQDFGSSAIDYAIKKGKKEKKFDSCGHRDKKFTLLFLPGQKYFAARRYAKETGNYNDIINEENISRFKDDINNLVDRWIEIIPKGRLYFVWNCFILGNHNVEYANKNDKYSPNNIHYYLEMIEADPFFDDLKSYIEKNIKFDNKTFLNPIITQEKLMKDCCEISNKRDHLKDRISCILDELIPLQPQIEYYDEYEYGNPDELYESQIMLTHHRLTEKIINILIQKIGWKSNNLGVDWIDYFMLFKSYLEEGKQVYNYYIDFWDEFSTDELINDYNFYKDHQVHRNGLNKQKFIYLKSCKKDVDEYEKIWKQLDTETEGILKKIGNSKEIEKILYEIINREKKINETLINLRKSLEKVHRILT